ncbi:MAG: hypothetical protein WCP91_03265 [Candidatus Berkelbacteria bacterium]
MTTSKGSDPRPKIIQETGFEFDWDDKKVWELPIEAEEMPIKEFLWHLDIPVWETEGTDDWNLTPREALENPEREPHHIQKIESSDLKYPIDVMWNKGKWTLLDGYHRLARAYQPGDKTIRIRKIPREFIPEITVKLWKDYKKGDE